MIQEHRFLLCHVQVLCLEDESGLDDNPTCPPAKLYMCTGGLPGQLLDSLYLILADYSQADLSASLTRMLLGLHIDSGAFTLDLCLLRA